MNKTNLEIIYQIAQNLVDGHPILTTLRDTSAWRIVDACGGSMIIANDASDNLPNGVTQADTECLNVNFEQLNHSGLGWDTWENSINADEIISDITFTKEEATFNEDTGAFISAKVSYEQVIPKEELGEYGFTFEYLVISECGCVDEANTEFPCGTDINELNTTPCEYCDDEDGIEPLEQAGYLLQRIYNRGDRDECSMKHIINGLCLIYTGSDPTNQELYADYSSAGYNKLEWDKYEEDESYEPKTTFDKELWQELKELVCSMEDGDKEEFYRLAHPYGAIADDHWMTYYIK